MKIEGAKHWNQIREKVPVGSLFFTKAKGLMAHMISCRSPVAHVGMILPYGGRIFGLDSTMQKTRQGVDLFNFSSLFHPMNGEVYLFPLEHTNGAKTSFYQDAEFYSHQPYERSAWRLYRFYFGFPLPETTDTIFCSELMVRMFNRAYGTGFKPSQYHPKHLFYASNPIGNLLYQLKMEDTNALKYKS